MVKNFDFSPAERKKKKILEKGDELLEKETVKYSLFSCQMIPRCAGNLCTATGHTIRHAMLCYASGIITHIRRSLARLVLSRP